ncbi:hypothetical protein [Mycetocola zhujimingii]|nr:hypothetical protein [Mycetocola zhujimingii]
MTQGERVPTIQTVAVIGSGEKGLFEPVAAGVIEEQLLGPFAG